MGMIMGPVVAAALLAQSVYSLPKLTNPERLALASDGAVWMTNQYVGVTRLSPSGATQPFLDRDDEFVTEIAAGPDGSAWVIGIQGALRIDPQGRVTRLPVDASAVAVASVGDAAWIAYEGVSGAGPSLVRVSADGTRRTFDYHAPRGSFGVNGIAGGPDGSVWFTKSGVGHGWIGRMTADGAFAYWAVPQSFGDPGRISAGPDGSMWFTGRHVIARITANGELTALRVGGEAAPHDIVAGADGALWFTSDLCLSRISGTGSVSTWPVPGALQLNGLAAAADGSFWLADTAGNAIRHFTPAAAAPAPCGAATLTRRAGPTAATVAFERNERFSGVDFFSDIHVHIARDGQERFTETVPGLRGFKAVSDSESLTVRDLDGDGEPEAMLVLNSNGAHCCAWSRIYRYDRARNTYDIARHFWGSGGAEPVLRDLDGDRRPEFLSLDDRFSDQFVSFASSARPAQIWSYRRGTLRDVTRRYPDRIHRDAATLWRAYRKDRKTNARGILPAWMADQYLLGRQASADRVLEQAAARGELASGAGPDDSAAFVKAVKAFLLRTGYRR